MAAKNNFKARRGYFSNPSEENLIITSGDVRVHNNNSQPASHVGKMKGIQGKDNSCYADTFLMSLFYMERKFEELFHLNNVPDNETEIQLNLLKSMRTIVLQLRAKNFCDSSLVSEFRNILSKIDKRFADGNMMDVVDLLSTLCGTKGLNVNPFLTYDTGTSNFYHQITVSTQAHSNRVDLQTLLEMSLDFQRLKIKSASCLFVKMPRSAGKLVGFKSIIPVETLNIQMSKEKIARRFTLHAVICLLHCHYTTFIKSTSGNWIFFDSMAKLNTPVVSSAPAVQEFFSIQAKSQQKIGVERLDKNMDPLIEHMVTNCHLCIYVEEGNSDSPKHSLSDENMMETVEKESVQPPAESNQSTRFPDYQHVRSSTVETSVSLRRDEVNPSESRTKEVPSTTKSKLIAKNIFEPEIRNKLSTSASFEKSEELKEPDPSEDSEESPNETGFHVRTYQSSLAALQYALWRYPTVFNNCFDESASKEMKEKIKLKFIDPLNSTGKCDLENFDVKAFFSFSVSQERWPEPAVFLKKMQFKPIIPPTISGEGKPYYELQGWESKKCLVKLDDAIKQTLNYIKIEKKPDPAFIVTKSQLSGSNVFPNLTLDMKTFIDGQKTRAVFNLHAVICKTQTNYYVYVRTDETFGEKTKVWIHHDPTKGQEKRLDLDLEIKNCNKLSDLTKETKTMYENGCMWIYVPRKLL